MFEKGF